MPDFEKRLEGQIQPAASPTGGYDVVVTDLKQRGDGSWAGRILVRGGGVQEGVSYRVVLKDGRQAVGQASGLQVINEGGQIAHGCTFITDGPFK